MKKAEILLPTHPPTPKQKSKGIVSRQQRKMKQLKGKFLGNKEKESTINKLVPRTTRAISISNLLIWAADRR